ncbi:MAG: glycosyltransferase family 4 protein [Ruminococcus sp.]|nr:glycosyltransferase family 4 protein [Ruminococcus sp.]
MIIISDCLTNRADEGTIKIASKIARLMKEHQAAIFQLNDSCSFSDQTFRAGRFGISNELLKRVAKEEGNILYIPNASMTKAVCIKILILRMLTRKKIFLLPVYRRKVTNQMALLLRMAGVELIVLSKESNDIYKSCLPNRVHYVRAGVDTNQFSPVSEDQAIQLRNKYGYDVEKTIVLHVGHMVEARNIRRLMELDKNFQIILLVSTSTRWDEKLYEDLSKCENIKIIHEYIPHIEEFYQMADVYYFPVEQTGCVDVPLSVLEAAACGTPIVSTEYGELKSFEESKGFLFIKDFADSNKLIEEAKKERHNLNREKIKAYDWHTAVDKIFEICGGK